MRLGQLLSTQLGSAQEEVNRRCGEPVPEAAGPAETAKSAETAEETTEPAETAPAADAAASGEPVGQVAGATEPTVDEADETLEESSCSMDAGPCEVGRGSTVSFSFFCQPPEYGIMDFIALHVDLSLTVIQSVEMNRVRVLSNSFQPYQVDFVPGPAWSFCHWSLSMRTLLLQIIVFRVLFLERTERKLICCLKKNMVHFVAAFCVLETAPLGHKFYANVSQPTEPKAFQKALRHELGLLRTSLPRGIHVKTFEDRMDLFAVLIEGPAKTPYEGGLFLFDFQLPNDYPRGPPLCHYWLA